MLKIGQRILVVKDLTNECDGTIGLTGTITRINNYPPRSKYKDHIYAARLDGHKDRDFIFLPGEIEPIQCYPDLDKIQLNFYEYDDME